VRGQLLEVGHELAQPLAHRGLVSVRSLELERVVESHHGRARAQERDAFVVGDPEQPGLEPDRARLPSQAAQRRRHRVLQCVGRVLRVAEERAAVAVDGLVVALVDHRERALVAGGGQAPEPVVAKRPEPGREDSSLR
jgi:hypothetical protein